MRLIGADVLKQHTRDMHENYALDVFDYAVVEMAMKNAASKGFSYLHIHQNIPADLSHTSACKHLVTKLKKAGHRVQWIDVGFCHDQEQDKQGGIDYKELRIFWGDFCCPKTVLPNLA